jgi:hypothetical protein
MIFLRIFLCLLCVVGGARGHQVASVQLEFTDRRARWELEGEIDIAYMMPETRNVPGGPPMSRLAVMKAPPEELARIRRETEKRLRELIRFTFAGRDLPWRVEFPDFHGDSFELPEDAADAALITSRMVLDAVPGTGDLRVFWSGAQETELIILTETGREERIISALPGGNVVLLKQMTTDTSPGTPKVPTTRQTPTTEGWVRSGFHHVLGIDHVLFLLGLFLLVPGWRPLLQQSLLFTLAHSLSLALATFRIVQVPGIWVEHLIALSIAWIGIENLWVRKLGPQRLVLVFAFGLLHGLGYATVLAGKLRSLSGRQLALPLFEFNVGVELAQISVLAVAFALLWPVRAYTPQIRMAGSAIIALVGLAWLGQRLFFPGVPLF